MAAFKDNISRPAVERLGAAVGGEVPGFEAGAFADDAVADLEPLELKARIAAVAAALDRALPGPFADAAPRVATAVRAAGLTAWDAWPALTWVEQAGLGDPEVALDALAAMTASASAEFAIRPFIAMHPDATWARLAEWARAPDEHLRRLASEGTRPRLPWGGKVAALQADPGPGIALLDVLRDDPEEYVRRSVANHLNDVARDDPDLALATAARWSGAGGKHVDAVVRHALRGLVKRGDPRALALIGADVHAPVDAVLTLGAAEATIGGSMPFTAELTGRGDASATVVLDYAVAYARPSGRTGRKVFKITTLELEPGTPVTVERRLSLADRSIRTHHPGEHRIELLVNGRAAAAATFELRAG